MVTEATLRFVRLAEIADTEFIAVYPSIDQPGRYEIIASDIDATGRISETQWTAVSLASAEWWIWDRINQLHKRKP